MTSTQKDVFFAASGIDPSHLNVDIRLVVGVVAIVVSMLVLSGLMHLLDSTSAWDKIMFIISVLMMSFFLMLIFIYVA